VKLLKLLELKLFKVAAIRIAQLELDPTLMRWSEITFTTWEKECIIKIAHALYSKQVNHLLNDNGIYASQKYVDLY